MQLATQTNPPDSGTEVDDLIYAISHDLRASIRAIRELPDWLRSDLTDQGVDLSGGPDELIDLMRAHAGKLDQMLAGLLAYSRVGRLQDAANLDPQHVFKEVVAAIAPPDTVSFFCRFNPAMVRMGPADMAKTFEVLLSNAIAHGHGKTGADIEVTSCQSGDQWELLVADNGPGIPADQVHKVTQPMTRLSGQSETSGAGMGLAILARIVETYEGTLSIESRKRRGGCLIRLRLPVLAKA